MTFAERIEKDGAQATIEYYLTGTDLGGSGRSNHKPIATFMEKYKGKMPYVAFVVESIPSMSLNKWIRPGLDYDKLNTAMRKAADMWAYTQKEEAAKAAREEKVEVSA